jgi:hypothetical protein
LWIKKKSGDDSARPDQIAMLAVMATEGCRMWDALRLNATVVVLLSAASAVNGIMFYHYL